MALPRRLSPWQQIPITPWGCALQKSPSALLRLQGGLPNAWAEAKEACEEGGAHESNIRVKERLKPTECNCAVCRTAPDYGGNSREGVSWCPLGPLGSSSSQHRRTLELILQEGSAFPQASNPRSERTGHCRRNSPQTLQTQGPDFNPKTQNSKIQTQNRTPEP